MNNRKIINMLLFSLFQSPHIIQHTNVTIKDDVTWLLAMIGKDKHRNKHFLDSQQFLFGYIVLGATHSRGRTNIFICNIRAKFSF